MRFDASIFSSHKDRSDCLYHQQTFKMQIDALLSETAEIVVDIYDAILSDYVQASREEVLQKQDKLHHLYDALFEQTIECSYLIKGYANKTVDGTAK